MPRSDFEKRDGNMASKDIAESPTAELEAEPERPKQNNPLLSFLFPYLHFIQRLSVFFGVSVMFAHVSCKYMIT